MFLHTLFISFHEFFTRCQICLVGCMILIEIVSRASWKEAYQFKAREKSVCFTETFLEFERKEWGQREFFCHLLVSLSKQTQKLNGNATAQPRLCRGKQLESLFNCCSYLRRLSRKSKRPSSRNESPMFLASRRVSAVNTNCLVSTLSISSTLE